MDGARNRESHRHLTWLGGSDLKSSLVHENAIRYVAAALRHNWPQRHGCNIFEVVFDVVQLQDG